MITTNGKLHIKRYLALMVPVIGGSIAFGLGGNAESVGDTALNFEVDRADINLTSYDFVNNKLIFKAPIPSNFAGKVYEVAVFSRTGSGLSSSRMISSFDSASENWTTGGAIPTYTSVNTRIGPDSLSHSHAASTTVTSSMSNLLLDFSTNAGSDIFKFAYNLGTANTASLRFRFMTNSTNYYEFTSNTAMTAGYKIVSFTKSAATVTGTPDWANITEVQILSTAGAGGVSTVELDGIRIDDSINQNTDYVMVSRDLLTTPFTKKSGAVQEIEIALDINIT